MSEITNSIDQSKYFSGNYIEPSDVNIQKIKFQPVKINQALVDEYVVSKKKRGLFERFFAKIANISPFGTNSRKINKAIQANAQGQTSEDKVKDLIKKDEKSVKFGTDLTISTISTAAAMSVGFFGKNISGLVGAFSKPFAKKINTKVAIASVGVGAITNFVLQGVNHITKPKEVREKNDLKNMTVSTAISGVGGYLSAINPLMLPITFVSNLVTHYKFSSDSPKENSLLNNFGTNQ